MIRITLQRDMRNLSMQGWTRDLSETGLSVFVAQGLLLGEFVTLEIPLTPHAREKIPSRVVRCRGTEYGFQFMALSAEQRVLIRETLKGHRAIPLHGVER